MSEDGGNGFGQTVTSDASAAFGKTQMNDPLIGKVLDGRYQIEKVLGEGGMGVVYRAVHTTLGKPLAIKVLRADVSKNEEILARFKREAQSASAIGNQHIIDISDFGTLPDNSTYFVMEYLGGKSLTKALAENKFSVERTVHVATQLCNALGSAHEIGIIHRDLKPDNVQLIERGGDKDFVKVLDFGIAKVGGTNSKLTQAGQVFGTPHYMSPEQCAGTNVDHRTDIYALGVILYELATGRVPFDADNLMGILTKHLYENPLPPREFDPPINVPPALEAVIMKALSKKREARYQSMAEMASDLDAIAKGSTPKAVIESVDRGAHGTAPIEDIQSSVSVGVPSSQELTIKKSNLPLIIGIAAVVLVGIGAVVIFAMSGSKSESETANVMKPAAAPTQPASAPSTAPTTNQASVAATAKVRLNSVPSGAEVYFKGAFVGNTPYEMDKPQGDAVVELTLKKAGYEEKKIKISSLTSSSMELTLNVKREAASRPAKVTAPPPPPPPTKKATEPAKREPKKKSRKGDSLKIGPANEVLDPWN